MRLFEVALELGVVDQRVEDFLRFALKVARRDVERRAERDDRQKSVFVGRRERFSFRFTFCRRHNFRAVSAVVVVDVYWLFGVAPMYSNETTARPNEPVRRLPSTLPCRPYFDNETARQQLERLQWFIIDGWLLVMLKRSERSR